MELKKNAKNWDHAGNQVNAGRGQAIAENAKEAIIAGVAHKIFFRQGSGNWSYWRGAQKDINEFAAELRSNNFEVEVIKN